MFALRPELFPSEELAARYRECLHKAQEGKLEEARKELFVLLGEPMAPSAVALLENDLAVLAYLSGDRLQADDWFRRALVQDPSSELIARNRSAVFAGSAPLAPTASRPVSGDRFLGPARDKRKIAVVSLLFNWPSTGGGNVHTVGLINALRQAGYSVRHLFARYEPWKIGSVNEPLPYPTEALGFTTETWSLSAVQQAIRAALERDRPDMVLLTDSWNTKPWLAEAIAPLPYLLRFDALECLCPLNNLRLLPTPDKNVRTCPRSQLATPEECATCVNALGSMSGSLHQVEREFAKVGSPHYQERLKASLRDASAVLVHNPLIEALVEPFASKTCVVPIGVDSDRFQPITQRHEGGPIRLLFAGRVNDIVKGFPVLEAAGYVLWQRRQDFRIVATGRAPAESPPFIEWVGWQPYAELPALLANADILIAPSVAQEPLGLSAIEGMAAGIPVIASEVGGLQYTVIDGLTGWLCSPGEVIELAHRIEQLLDDAELRLRMGQAGRSRFEQFFAWPAIIKQHYEPLLGITSSSDAASPASLLS
ncbi:MAG: glycosyltransferase family 4 protein [Pirellulales bacterium]